jgi:hypothetical protein
MAIGFTGDPVAPGMLSEVTTGQSDRSLPPVLTSSLPNSVITRPVLGQGRQRCSRGFVSGGRSTQHADERVQARK